MEVEVIVEETVEVIV